MYKIVQYLLGDANAKSVHEQIIMSNDAYTLTLTLNPFYNKLSVDEQYNKMVADVKALFERLGPFIKEVFITAEYTQDYNVHFHVYFTSSDIFAFEQNYKYYKKQYYTIGNNYKLKKIDQVTAALKNYPFKDIERTLKYADAVFNRFVPRHIHIISVNTFKAKYSDGYNKECKHCTRYNSICCDCLKKKNNLDS